MLRKNVDLKLYCTLKLYFTIWNSIILRFTKWYYCHEPVLEHVLDILLDFSFSFFFQKSLFQKLYFALFDIWKISIFNLSQFWILLTEVRVQIFQRPAECRSRLFGSLPTAHAQKVKGEKLYSVHIWLTYLTVPLKHPQGYRLAVIPTDFHFLRHAPI